MAPGIDGLPAAERDVDVSGPVANFLRSLSPVVLMRLRLGLRAFEWLPFPWRFSRLDLTAREDFLRRMERSRLGIFHELLLMGKVFTTLGDNAINIMMISTSPIRISCVVPGDRVPDAVKALHSAFELSGDGTMRPEQPFGEFAS